MERLPRVRNVCFTVNQVDEKLLLLLDMDHETWNKVKYCIYQRELGSNEHFQGYMELNEAMSYNAMHLLDGLETAHFERRRGTAKQAADYCRKQDDTYIEGPWEIGVISHQGTRQDLVDVQVSIIAGHGLKRIAEDHPVELLKYPSGIRLMSQLLSKQRSQETICFVFYGAGGTGKSTFARLLASYLGSNTFFVPCAKGSGLYWDGYNQGDVVIMDEFKGNRMQPTFFNMLIDGGPIQVPVHGSTMHFDSRYVIITTNVTPMAWWPNLEYKFSLRRRIIIWPIFRSLRVRTPAPQVPVFRFNGVSMSISSNFNL